MDFYSYPMKIAKDYYVIPIEGYSVELGYVYEGDDAEVYFGIGISSQALEKAEIEPYDRCTVTPLESKPTSFIKADNYKVIPLEEIPKDVLSTKLPQDINLPSENCLEELPSDILSTELEGAILPEILRSKFLHAEEIILNFKPFKC
ncbi:MAG: hypothetical protein KAU95_02525 [Candidatus Aenigmarchaeota archaeon]|nr:hypothetical protein [Candidatus Aenigmarchaeota archaeon]